MCRKGAGRCLVNNRVKFPSLSIGVEKFAADGKLEANPVG